MVKPGQVGPKRLRAGGAWAAEKLEFRRYYLGGAGHGGGGFMKATQRAGGSACLDLFAGPGQVRLPTGELIDGSPLIAAQAMPSFSRLFWSDADPGNAASLRAHRGDFPDRHIDVLEGDANALIDGILTDVSRTQPALAFLDPEGSELAWETVRKISAHKPPPHNKIEQFILFATDTGYRALLPARPKQADLRRSARPYAPGPSGVARAVRAPRSVGRGRVSAPAAGPLCGRNAAARLSACPRTTPGLPSRRPPTLLYGLRHRP
jgi:three-Cys-motif partner protein